MKPLVDGSTLEELETKTDAPPGTWPMFFPGGALADVMTFERRLQVGMETDCAKDSAKLPEARSRRSSRAREHPPLPELEVD